MEEKKLTPQQRYDAKNIKRLSLKLNVKYDADILEFLDNCDNKQGAMKEAIRLLIASKNAE